jgi:hypothetical protein
MGNDDNRLVETLLHLGLEHLQHVHAESLRRRDDERSIQLTLDIVLFGPLNRLPILKQRHQPVNYCVLPFPSVALHRVMSTVLD